MGKFKIRLKLQGFELEVEGNREDVPLISQNVGAQIAGLLEPAARIVEGEAATPRASVINVEPIAESARRKSRRARRPSTQNVSAIAESDDAVVDWKHDPARWGVPQQGWSTAEKALWLLYVASQEANARDMTGKSISETFNKHFRQAGTIRVQNINRDFGRLKISKDAPVAEDTTKTLPTWFLTQAGERKAHDLVARALGRT